MSFFSCDFAPRDSNEYVQFKEANESKLMQWFSLPTEDAYGWRVLTSDEWSYLLVNGGVQRRAVLPLSLRRGGYRHAALLLGVLYQPL